MLLDACTHFMYMYVGLGWCFIPLADISSKIKIIHVRACMIWLKLHTIGIHCFPGAHIPRQMHTPSLILLANWQHLQTNVCMLKKMMAGHIRHWKTGVCRIQIMLAIHVWRRQIDVCMLRTMLSGHIRCWQTDVSTLCTMLEDHVWLELTFLCTPMAMRADQF